jgi:hypothetical protein
MHALHHRNASVTGPPTCSSSVGRIFGSPGVPAIGNPAADARVQALQMFALWRRGTRPADAGPKTSDEPRSSSAVQQVGAGGPHSERQDEPLTPGRGWQRIRPEPEDKNSRRDA